MNGVKYVMRNGTLVEVGRASTVNEAAFVHNDSMQALRNPVTGQIYESKSQYLKSVNKLGMEVVGTEKLSDKPQVLKEHITETMVMDRMARAEAILDDPTKLRARHNENLERLSRHDRLFNVSR